ncbi:MAG: TrmH family RNA methyltransferase, partial [Chitinophagaceae bacterium]|nr:TrmH family RNA methyltransferase [Chitinophagaceae bacterium]
MSELGRKSVEEFRQSQKFPLVVVLDNVRSMHNVGSVFRTADAFLISGILLCGYTPRPPHRDIQKTALGATETVDWDFFESTLDAVDQLKSQGYRIFAVEQVEKSIPLQEFSSLNSEKMAVIFG